MIHCRSLYTAHAVKHSYDPTILQTDEQATVTFTTVTTLCAAVFDGEPNRSVAEATKPYVRFRISLAAAVRSAAAEAYRS